jgi:hypothetical protein
MNWWKPVQAGWRLFARWSRLDLDYSSLTAGERWSVVMATLKAMVRSRLLRPVRLRLLAHVPVWVVAKRLQRRSHGWYRVPNAAAAEHVRLRFDIWPIEVGDHVQLRNGRLVAIGYTTPHLTEIISYCPMGSSSQIPEVPRRPKRGSRMRRRANLIRCSRFSAARSRRPASVARR